MVLIRMLSIGGNENSFYWNYVGTEFVIFVSGLDSFVFLV